MEKNSFSKWTKTGTKLLALLLIFAYGIKAKAQTDADMLDKAIASVVTVAVFKTDENKKALGFRGNKTNAQKAYERLLDLTGVQVSGSGFVIEQGGKKYIITNAHVVESAADDEGSLYVFSIDRTKYPVKVVGGDSYFDLAVLEFLSTPGKEIETIKFAAKDGRIGEKVFAIGNPLGDYPYTVTDGIISAKNRVRNGVTGKFGFLQSTATVIWGNSGGPLINAKGEVVGMNSQIAFAANGGEQIWQPQINFALESPVCQRLINDVITNNGLVRRAYLGVEVTQTYEYNDLMALFGYPWILNDTLPVIKNVIPGSPAFTALSSKVGAQIYSVNGTTVRNNNEVLGEFEKVKPGDVVKMTLVTSAGKENVEFKTVEISTAALERLATYVLESTKEYKVLKDDNGGVVMKTASDDQYASRSKKSKNTVGPGIKELDELDGSTSYQVISAGVQFTNFSSKYRVKKLSDLGAALRLTGETGTVEVYVIDQNDPYAEPMVIRYSLAGSDYMSQNTLWY